MHEVYQNMDSAKVGLINGLLEDQGIHTVLHNWTAANITSIPIPALYPSIRVETSEDADKARALIDEFFNSDASDSPKWICSKCNESVDGNFSECWSCQTPKNS